MCFVKKGVTESTGPGFLTCYSGWRWAHVKDKHINRLMKQLEKQRLGPDQEILSFTFGLKGENEPEELMLEGKRT